MRFLFVGDSMTIGRNGEETWRYWMARHLRGCPACVRPGGGPASVVGPWTHQYADGDSTGAGSGTGTAVTGTAGTGREDSGREAGDASAGRHRHLAAWGEGWLHMASRIGAAVSDHRPDVLLVSLGLIDLGFYTDSAGTDANVRRFFAEARAAGPRIRAVVLPVVPNVRATTDAPFAAEVERFNGLLARTLAGLTLPGSPLTLAPSPTAPPVSYGIASDTYDGTHPSPSGARKLAAAFAHALHAPPDPTAPSPPALPAAAMAGPGSTGAPVSLLASVESV
ncbi:GDSL-type esterase/lipase family protein [Streptomyces sp. NBC_01497]|uniref:GDSL-type esterase/lipase family protein n=1 Tax=Streptomyces sp. NBC_01497 TaxID=2903885 RepID=UPI002E37C26A|nr:GDSL-type esterase/lipase family protein [Streptomyces sp. NBC_01497]